jgi:hypothetical protein
MKKVSLILGGTMYNIYFVVSDINGYRVNIKSIVSATENCISIMGFNMKDIEQKVILSQKMWSSI